MSKAVRTRATGPKDVQVDAAPFIAWLKRQNREGWSVRLPDSQVRYVERYLADDAPPMCSPYAVDLVFVQLDKPWLLNYLYAV